MKKQTLIIAFVLSIASVTAQDKNWDTTKDNDRNYRIDFPSSPTASSQEVPTDVGPINMDMYMLDLSADASSKNLIYMTAYSEYPEMGGDYSDESLQQSMLDGSVDGAVSNVNGTLISVEKIKFNGFNGRMAKVSLYDNAYIIYLKNVLVENKLYFIQVITTKEHDNNAEIKRFFDSFELLKTN